MRTAARIRKDKAVERVYSALLSERPFLLNRFHGEQRRIKSGATIYCIMLNGTYMPRKPGVSRSFGPHPVFIKEDGALYVSAEAAKKGSYDKKLIRKVTRNLRNEGITCNQMDMYQMGLIAAEGTAGFVRRRFITPCTHCDNGTFYTDPGPCPECGRQQ